MAKPHFISARVERIGALAACVVDQRDADSRAAAPSYKAVMDMIGCADPLTWGARPSEGLPRLRIGGVAALEAARLGSGPNLGLTMRWTCPKTPR